VQALEGAILRQDPALASASYAARAVPRPGRRAAGAFAGRERELALLEAGLADALDGRGRVFVVSGGADSGKSRLADEVASRAKELGFRVLWARGWDAGGAPPLWAWQQLLRSYARAGGGMRPLPDVNGCDSDEACFAVFDTVADFFVRASETEPLLLVLDDLDAADQPSLLLLRFLADVVAERPIAVVATWDEAERPEELAGLARHGATPLRIPELVRAA
jgi:eukaryotic-like serine/threonine-protein kinase